MLKNIAKRIASTVLCAVLLAGIMPAAGATTRTDVFGNMFAACADGREYRISIVNGEVTILELLGTQGQIKGDYTVPSELGGYPVAAIGTGAFDGFVGGWEGPFDNPYLLSVTIPGSIRTIGDRAFANNPNLTRVTIGRGLSVVSAFSFGGALANITVAEDNPHFTVTNNVLFNKDKTTLVLYPPRKPLSTYTVPGSVTTIGVGAFAGNTLLTRVTIPDSVRTIRDAAFSGNSQLTHLVMGSGIQFMSRMAFYRLDALRSISVSAANPHFTATNGVLFDKNKRILILYPEARAGTSYTIPSSVRTVGQTSFYHARFLRRVTIPSSVTRIGRSAFAQTERLERVTIHSPTATIGAEGLPRRGASLTVHAHANSTAQRYAARNGHRFRLINTPRPNVSTQGRRRRTVNRGANVTLRVSISRPNNQGRTSLRWQRR